MMQHVHRFAPQAAFRTSPPKASSEVPGRLLDVALAAIALIFLCPILAVTALAILLENKGPVFFSHPRLGMGGRVFNVLKFRTMRSDGDQVLAELLERDAPAAAEWARDHKLREDPRVTSLGRLLRKSSLDELPQLINVIRGDMSLVGPRPITGSEAQRYGAHFDAYCSVRPGITGVWQVSGRNDVSYAKRVQMDAHYAQQKSILFDLRVMIATVPAVLGRKGSY